MNDADGGRITRHPVWSYIGVGCLTVPVGFFGGGMIAVLIGKVVGTLTGCRPPEGFPACNTFQFLLTGGLIGLIGLPAAALIRLRQGRKAVGPDTASPGGRSGSS